MLAPAEVDVGLQEVVERRDEAADISPLSQAHRREGEAPVCATLHERVGGEAPEVDVLGEDGSLLELSRREDESVGPRSQIVALGYAVHVVTAASEFNGQRPR